MHESHQSVLNQATSSVECLKDLTGSVEIKASSRQAMIGSLTDGSTETFWESGDEDRNKTKSLTIVCVQNHHPSLVCVHIDNCRDLGVSFYHQLENFVIYFCSSEQSFKYYILFWTKYGRNDKITYS